MNSTLVKTRYLLIEQRCMEVNICVCEYIMNMDPQK